MPLVCSLLLQEAELTSLEAKVEAMAGGEPRLRAVEARLEGMEERLSSLVRGASAEGGLVCEEEVAQVHSALSGQLMALLDGLGGMTSPSAPSKAAAGGNE